MIINFSVKNFKSIKDKISISFEATPSKDLEDYYIVEPKKGLRLLKIGLIYGANGSGKTNVLESIDFLRGLVLEPEETKLAELNVIPFLFDDISASGNTFFELEFIQSEVKYRYEVELNKSAIVSEKLFNHNPNKALVFERTTNLEAQLTHIKFGRKLSINKRHQATLEANTLWNNTVLGGYLKTNFESIELQEATTWFKQCLKPVIKSKSDLLVYISQKLEQNEINKAFVIEFLKKADFKITDIILKKEETELTPELLNFLSSKIPIPEAELQKIRERGKIEGKEIWFQHKVLDKDGNFSERSLPYHLESQGTQRYYQFSGLLDIMIRHQVLFPIDELEASLHPDLIKHFILTFLVNAKNAQLIATTHFREFLNERDLFRNDAIWFTEKQKNGSTDLFSLSDFDSSIIRNTSSVYNAYKIGKLGAVPQLQDHYIQLENG